MSLLPWQQKQWQQLLLSRQNERFAHALLLSGPRGTGPEQFAGILAASLLCSAPLENLLPCGQCRACSLFETGNHPDICWIKPAEGSKQIKVEKKEPDDPIQIREMINFIHLKSQYERYKIAVITPADSMNRSAANTLLKTLEEPPDSSLLVLISDRPDLLPITIRSRCQQLYFKPVYDQVAFSWLQARITGAIQPDELLKLAGGAPLAALELIEQGEFDKHKTIITDLESLQNGKMDPVKVAETWNTYSANEVLKWLMQILRDMLRIKTSAKPAGFYQPDMLTRMQRLTNRLDLYKLITCHDLAMKNYGLSTGLISYNSQGLLEDFIIYWQNQANNPGG